MFDSIKWCFIQKNMSFLILIMKNFDYLSLSGQHLLVFVTLHEVGTVTATAEKLDITQSAVSHSLQKMRDIFNDELFVRAGRSVAPTLRSEQLYPELKAMLLSLGKLTQSPVFTPKNANIRYKVLANDYQSSLLFPQVYARISPLVHSLSLEISPANKPTIDALRSNDVDFVVSPMPPNHDDIIVTRLYADIPHCFYDPRVRTAPTNLDELHSSKFVSLTFTKGISLGSKTNDISQMLDKNTCLRVGNFSVIPNFIQNTDLLAIIPSMLQHTTGFSRLANAPLPYEVSALTMYMLWHKKYQKDAQHKWFREQVVQLAQTFRSE